MFLFLSDYNKLLTSADLETVLNADDSIRLETEVTAQGFISQYIRQRYDVSKIFKAWSTWSISTTYAIGDYFQYTETVFSATATYLKDARVSYEGYIYAAKANISTAGAWDATKWTQLCLDQMIWTCTAISVGHYPDNTSYFTQSDSRDSEIVRCMIVTTVYNMMPQIVPENIPEIWRKLFNGDGQWKKNDGTVIGTLVAWQAGELDPDLPIYTDDQAGQNITWNSQMRRNNSY
jgi:hypothetical protein